MASIPNLTSDTSKERVFETARQINITQKTVIYGSSVYQVRNITGFKAGTVPKEKFPFQAVLGLVAVGVVVASFTPFGWLLLILAGFLVYQHFTQVQYYGLSIFLNSGKELFFKSPDKQFITKVVANAYALMEGQQDGVLVNDFSTHNSNYSPVNNITAGGDIIGAAIGDNNLIDVRPQE